VSFLTVPVSPRLPDPEEELSPAQWRQLLLVLRLYFTQMDAVMRALLGRNGMQFLEAPEACYYNDANQTILGGSPLPVRFPLFTNEQGFTQPTVSQISPDHAGTYYFQATLNYANIGGADRAVSAWIAKNGVDIPTTLVEITIPSNDIQTISLNYILDLLPTDVLTIFAYCALNNTELHSPGVAAPAPRGASCRLNIFLISNDSTASITPPAFRMKKRVFDPPP
jgi:hypothetical protein